MFDLTGLDMRPTFKKTCKKNNKRQEKQSIILKIWCKTDESLPQVGHDEKTNILEHTCEDKYYGLHSRNILWRESHQHGRSKRTNQEQSTVKTRSQT